MLIFGMEFGNETDGRHDIRNIVQPPYFRLDHFIIAIANLLHFLRSSIGSGLGQFRLSQNFIRGILQRNRLVAD